MMGQLEIFGGCGFSLFFDFGLWVWWVRSRCFVSPFEIVWRSCLMGQFKILDGRVAGFSFFCDLGLWVWWLWHFCLTIVAIGAGEENSSAAFADLTV